MGYRIIARNHHCPGGELDLVAWDGETLCFIEVRARASVDYGHPLETITPHKRRRIIRAAAHYLTCHPGPHPQMRFDALGILLTATPQFFLVRDAFEAGVSAQWETR